MIDHVLYWYSKKTMNGHSCMHGSEVQYVVLYNKMITVGAITRYLYTRTVTLVLQSYYLGRSHWQCASWY